MAIILILIFFLGTINYYFQKKKSLSLALTYTTLIIASATILITETSSHFKVFNYTSSILFWTITMIGIVFINAKEKYILLEKYSNWIKENKKVSLFFGGFTLLLFIQGILYPPNNWDSMTYHMARIAHWVMNESIEPYPTHIYRQIYQPPLAEWIIAQVCILNRADYLANAIQLFFLLATLGVVNQIMLVFNQSKKRRIIALILAFTTPSVFMQTTSTQNDIIVSFFLLSGILFLITYLKKQNISNALFVGLSIGCALLTKGTAFVYLLPVIIFYASYLLISIYKKQVNTVKLSLHILLIIGVTIMLAFNHYQRNYRLSGDIFGASDDHFFNKNITITSTGLGILKNIGNHFSLPVCATITNKIVEKTHLLSNIPIKDENYSYKGIHFKLNEWNHNEDEVSNFMQMILVFGLIVFLLFNLKTSNILLILSTSFCLLGFFLFAFLLKWQPWHIRLQVPLFIMFAIPIAIFLDSSLSNKTVLFILSLSIAYCLILSLYNPNRPLIKNYKQAKLTTRFEKYFVAMPPFLNEYKTWRYKLKNKTKQNWEVHGDTWEYPIYYDCFSEDRKAFNAINIKNQSKELINPFK